MREVAPQCCYVIVYHRDAPAHDRYKNRWTDSWVIEEVLTEPWVAEKCREAGSVYIYRCRWLDWPPCVACRADVEGMGEPEYGAGSPLVRVRFKNARKLNVAPPFKARPGDICKPAPAPTSRT